MRTMYFFLLGCFLICVSATAQQSAQPMRFGAYGGYGFNMHSASFSELPGVPSCCPQFESGSGAGMTFGGLLNIPFTSRLSLDLRAGMTQQSGLLTAEEATGVIIGGVPKSGAFEHSIDADLTVVAVEPSVALRVAGGFSVRAGLSAGLLISKKYSQKEQIIKPERSATFVDDQGNDTFKRTRNESSGEIPGTSQFQAAVLAGVGYDLPLTASRSLLVAPEITYTIPVTSLLADESWSVQTVRFGVAVKYAAVDMPPQPEIPPTRRVDTLRVPVLSMDSVRFAFGAAREYLDTTRKGGKTQIRRMVARQDTMFVLADSPGPVARLAATAVYADGRREEAAGISISTRFVSEALPLLSAVFFAQGSADVPERYIKRSPSITPIAHEEQRDPVLLHRDILNVVGERMRKLPESSLTLIGLTDPTTEPNRCDLARSRAEVVKTYLTEAWRIDPARITVAEGGQCTPQAITESPEENGYMENRRVEFVSSDARVLEPVWCRRTMEATEISPPVIEFDPAGSTQDGIRSWELVVYQGKNIIFTDSGSGTPAVVRQTFTGQEARALVNGVGLDVHYRLTDSLGRAAKVVNSMSVVRDTADIEIERMSLILFDISQNAVKDAARTEIMSFLAGLGTGDEVAVTGYTDILGADDYNRVLSERRAQTVCDFIKQVVPRANLVQCFGVANTKFPAHISSYGTPEERFLSRTVQIEIRRKLDGLY